MTSSSARLDAIRDILRRHNVSTQDELRQLLGERGIETTQPTLSRDMARLGVRRVAGVGGLRYEVGGDGAGVPLDPVRGLLESVRSNGQMVVIRTSPGAASTIARALDEARLEGVLGTLAGDDTVFVAPARAGGGKALAQKIRDVLGGG